MPSQPERWPASWDDAGGLTPAQRVRAVVHAITDGTTARPDQLRGLPVEKILEVERDQRAPMADAYREFLSLIGGGAGRFLQGSDIYHPRCLGLGTAARELLEENDSPFRFEPTDRVFFMHQGYEFEFLRGTGPDPEIWSYSEGVHGDIPALTHDSFTAWLRATADSAIPVWKHYAETVREEVNADGTVTAYGD